MGGRDDGQNWDGSRSWEEDIYWTHFQFIHFTQFLQTTTNFQQQLALPKTFSDNLKKKLPENVTLKGPSGAVWDIGLTTRDNTVYFVGGWERFVKDHSLKENDFLVFKYNGESLFEVLIFDGDNFCEKATSYFVRKCGHAQTEEGGSKVKNTNTSVEEVNTASNGGVDCGSPETFRVRRLDSIRTPLAVPVKTTDKMTLNAFFESASPKELPVYFPKQPTGQRTKKPANEVTPGQTKKRGRPPKEEAAQSRLSSAKDEKKLAQSFTSTFPYFVKIIKTFNVDGPRILNVPHQFSIAHLPNGKIKIILRNLKGEQWTANSVPRSRVHTSHTLCGGWMSFVRANNIKLGDVCVFELINDCELRVRVAEVDEDGLVSEVQKEGIDHQNGSCET
ncbi:B3 domain-containing protein REM16 isoform X4 [Medicago truncatula]|uniref:B3 domain-containing protein REM16 isoform X4 n=1 Tax=Medicago truncatula TaxID=3880 RepID=UPI001967A575|nr:B3 domain-containing protein REM16 isoform X4 [Medicago truncatula]